jgi:hypothetical protein
MRTLQAVPFVGVSAVTVAMATVISLPGVCLSFQPKVLPAPSVLLPHSTSRTKTTTTRLESRKQQHQDFQVKNDDAGSISFFNFDDEANANANNIDENNYNTIFESFADRISRQATNFAVMSILFFSIGTTVMGPALPAFADTPPGAPQQQESLLLKAASPEEVALKSKQQIPGEMSSSVIDEVWTLVDKYFLERSFNSQDWQAVRTKVTSQGQKVGFDDNKSMKIATEMVQSLGDKYTRMLDKEQYAAIQKFDLIGVGVTLMPNAQKEIIVGAPPIAGTASDKAGLKVGDSVTAVNGRPTRGRNAFDIIDQIGENPNSKTVSFSIRRDTGPSTLDSVGNPDASETFDVTMERQTMEVKDPVQYKISETRSDGTSTFLFCICICTKLDG